MKSEALNTDMNLIETIIAELIKQNVVINKKTCHGLDSIIKPDTIIRPSPSESSNISNEKLTPQKKLSQSLSQSCPEISINLLNINTPLVETFYKNQRGINLSQTKEDLSIDRNIEISLLGTAPQIHPKFCTPLPEHGNSNSAKPLCSKISKIEAQLSAFKSYVTCEIFSSHSKIESISQSLPVTLERGKRNQA